MQPKKVTLFVPCLVDQCFPRAAEGMVRILRRLGMSVDYPADQTCCGQPAFNSGYRAEAAQLARRFVDIFKRSEVIVAPSGSCVSMVRHYYCQLDLDAETMRRVDSLVRRTFEFSEFIVEKMGVTDLGVRFPHRVTYHDSCHLLRELRVKDPPRRLLRAVKGIDFVELEASDACCGFGGSFSMKFPSLSGAIGGEKVDNIRKLGVEYVVSGDAGCLMQITGALGTVAPGVRGLHLAELIGMNLA